MAVKSEEILRQILKCLRCRFFFLAADLNFMAQSFVASRCQISVPLSTRVSGRLYENGSNEIPHDHAADGLALAAQVKPVRGKFVLLAIGMSNCRYRVSRL